MANLPSLDTQARVATDGTIFAPLLLSGSNPQLTSPPPQSGPRFRKQLLRFPQQATASGTILRQHILASDVGIREARYQHQRASGGVRGRVRGASRRAGRQRALRHRVFRHAPREPELRSRMSREPLSSRRRERRRGARQGESGQVYQGWR